MGFELLQREALMLLFEGKYAKVLGEQIAYRVMKCNVVQEVICLTSFKPSKCSVSVTCPKSRDEIAAFAEDCSRTTATNSAFTFAQMQVLHMSVWSRNH